MKDLYGKKEKHDHKFSNLLKGCILAIVMLAPFFAILSKMIYVSVNKNAKDSYYGETINEETIEQTKDLQIGNKYYMLNQTLVDTYTQSGYIDKLFYINDLYKNNEKFDDIYSFKIYISSTGYELVAFNNQNTQIYDWYVVRDQMEINFIYMGKTNSNGSYTYEDVKDPFYEILYNKYSYLDNAFYYAIEQSKNEEILNWTKNTPIYNVINSMNTGLGLSANHILTYLLTYWSIILAIYIVFDIIIFAFTKITHYLQ